MRCMLLAFVLSLSLFVGSASATGSKSSSSPSFGHAVVVDHQRVTGEPSLSVSPTQNGSGYHDVYVSAPFGFSTTASFVWKSEDGGQTFHLIGAEVPPDGKPASTCAGGGDSSIVNDTAGNFYFADLQGFTDVSDSVSTDGGNTFVTTCNSANAGDVDRPWLASYGDPLASGREYMTVDQVNQCTLNCGLGQAGSNMVEVTQASGSGAATQVFSPLPAQQIEPDGIVGGAVVDQRNGDLYIVHTALTNDTGALIGGGDGNGNTNAIVVDRFPGGYSQPVATPIPPTSISLCAPYNTTAAAPCQSDTVVDSPLDSNGNSTANNGQDFATIAIDTSGNLYVVWAQSPVDSSGNVDGPTTIYMASSTNGGATWSAPINVSGHVSGLQTNVFPWIAAGSAGRVAIVWFGTPTLGSCPNSPCGAGFINGTWNVYMAQSLDATSSSPTFTTTKVTEYPNHYGSICEFGLACTTGGDRGLLDFIQVQADPSGAADVVWADGANTAFNGGETSAVIDYAQQVSGPGLYGTNVSGPAPLSGSAPGSPASYFGANGAETPAPPGSSVDIVRSSVSAGKSGYTVTMQVGSLLSLLPPPALGGTDLVWLTRWELPTSQPTTANQGHFYYAAMESDNGAPPTFYDGDAVCGVATTHCKFLTYPPGHAVKGSYSPSGTITITVPYSDVPGGSLFSVTGVTATQTESSSTGAALFNVIDSTPPYNVK
jgi:hypothetical protein